MTRPPVLALALRDVRCLQDWELPRWELLIRQARRADLLARIAVLLEEQGLLAKVPAAPRAHLEAGRAMSRAHEEAVRREITHICTALASVGVEAILLKGAAYLLAGVPAARGRLFSDVDILVPRSALGQVEAALMLQGWTTTHHHPYDQRYYRRWMHELPPLRHATRQSVLDVHHAILPLTARLKPDSAKLWAASRALPGIAPLRVLAPRDMVLHSATHLFFNEEFSHGLRDLADIDNLLRHFGSEPGFWEGLTDRARELELTRPLYYALRYTRQILDTPVPQATIQAIEAGRPWAPLGSLMDALLGRVLAPDHPSAADSLTPLAKQALYIRAHWLRMPPFLLAYHLTAKALRPAEPAPSAR